MPNSNVLHEGACSLSQPSICPRCFYHHPHRAVSTRPLRPELGRWTTSLERGRSFATPREAEEFSCAEHRYKLRQEMKNPVLMSTGLIFEVLAHDDNPTLKVELSARDLDGEQIRAGIESARAEIKEAQK